jgi:hypothetical protein
MAAVEAERMGVRHADEILTSIELEATGLDRDKDLGIR